MSKFFYNLRLYGLMVLLLFIFLYALIPLLDPFSGKDLILARFLTGFWHFIVGNFPLISWNADQWVPGLGAFFISWFFIHRWFSRWAKRTERPWSLMTSLCVVLLVPVLFVISFIVPGVLLQWEMLQDVHWVEIYR
jgi:hypothetical protein